MYSIIRCKYMKVIVVLLKYLMNGYNIEEELVKLVFIINIFASYKISQQLQISIFKNRKHKTKNT